MKNSLLAILMIALATFYVPQSHADDDDWDDDDYFIQPQISYYSPAPPIYAYPQTEVYYDIPPPPPYDPPQPPYDGYAQRSPQGLAGGVLGSVFGYQLGGGNPLASGLGAAVGSYVGNGFGSSNYGGHQLSYREDDDD